MENDRVHARSGDIENENKKKKDTEESGTPEDRADLPGYIPGRPKSHEKPMKSEMEMNRMTLINVFMSSSRMIL